MKVIFFKKRPIEILPPPKPFPSMEESESALAELEIPNLEPLPKKQARNSKSKNSDFDLTGYIAKLKDKDFAKGKKIVVFDVNEYLEKRARRIPIPKEKKEHKKTQAKLEQHESKSLPDIDGLDDLDLEKMDISLDKGFDFEKEMKSWKEPEINEKKNKKSKRKTGIEPKEISEPEEDFNELFEEIKGLEAKKPQYAQISLENADLEDSRKEIENAVKQARKISLFDKLFKKAPTTIKAEKSTSHIDESLPDAEKINRCIEESRICLEKFDLDGARKFYIMAMEIYNQLSSDEKSRFYDELKDLYNDRKSAESLGR